MEEQADVPKQVTATFSFRLLVVLATVVAICGIWVSAEYAVYHGRIHDGISIAGIDVGGMSPAEAVAVVGAAVDRARQNSITLIGGGTSWTLMPDDVGTRIDVTGAVRQAMAVTRYDDFLTDAATRIELHFRGRDLPLRGTVDEGKMQLLLSHLDAVMTQDAPASGLAVAEGSVSISQAREGHAIDRPALAERLKGLLFSLHSTVLEVPIKVTRPEVLPSDDPAAYEPA